MTFPARRLWARALKGRIAVAVLAVALLALTLPAGAAERVALVIGNSAYRSVASLKNPRNDADGIAQALERLDFKVIKGTDVDHRALENAVRAFTREIDQASIALFFYAGHGLQVNGRNYLIPVDATLQKESDIDFEAMDLNFVLRQLERKDRTNIVFLDACRNNPLARKLAASMGQRSVFVGRGLARIETGVGTFIGFATQPDNVALDGEGANSPFTEALLKHIETPGLDIELLMRRVREDVILATANKQVPWSNSSLVGDRVVLKAAIETEEAVTPLPRTDGTNVRDLELAFWNSVKDSGNAAFIRAYLATYPEGSFATLARAMVKEIEARQQANVRPADTTGKGEARESEQPLATLKPADEPATKEPPQPPVEQPPPPPSEETQAAPAPAVKQQPVARLAPVEEVKPRKPPAVQKKKKIEKPRLAKRPVERKVRVKRAERSEPVVAGPVSRCGLCYPNGLKSFGRRRYCGVAFQSAIADGFCGP